jgi:hypothetical protein
MGPKNGATTRSVTTHDVLGLMARLTVLRWVSWHIKNNLFVILKSVRFQNIVISLIFDTITTEKMQTRLNYVAETDYP